MQTQDISSDRWPQFFDDFTQVNRGKRINVETVWLGRGVRSERCDEPLLGIVAACAKTSDDDLIEVVTRQASGDHATHSIERPTRVCVAQEESGQPVALQIEAADGAITIVRFQPPRENMPQGFTVS